MYRWKESQSMLHQNAFDLQGTDVTFKVHYWGVNERLQSNPYHKHSFFEVCYVLGGEGRYLDRDDVYPIRQGMLFCSRPEVYHQITTGSGLSILFVAFEVNAASSVPFYIQEYARLQEQASVVIYDGDPLPAALLWKSLLLPDGQLPSIPAQALAPVAHSLLLSFLPLFGGSPRQATIRASGSSKVLINQAKLYIRDNLAEDLSLSKVAAHLNVSERHLSRLFSAGIRESFTAYLREEKIRQAAHLLRHSDKSIKEIADMTGFGSVHYFTRTFHRMMKATPAKYRG